MNRLFFLCVLCAICGLTSGCVGLRIHTDRIHWIDIGASKAERYDCDGIFDPRSGLDVRKKAKRRDAETQRLGVRKQLSSSVLHFHAGPLHPFVILAAERPSHSEFLLAAMRGAQLRRWLADHPEAIPSLTPDMLHCLAAFEVWMSLQEDAPEPTLV